MAAMRFWENVEVAAGCWPWTGRLSDSGYGVVNARGETMAHRLSWVLHRGPIPAGHSLDHLCHNADQACGGGRTCLHRRCVNPAHLEPVTGRVNTLRGRGPAARHAAKTSCDNGHPFAGANLRIDPSVSGTRRTCRACDRAAHARLRARRRAEAAA